MKIIFLIMIILSGCHTVKQDKLVSEKVSNKSTFNGDTLKYIQENFLNRKESYVNKELNNMLNNLRIPVMRFTNGTSSNDLTQSPFMYIYFNSQIEQDKRIEEQKNPTILVIKWQTPLKISTVDSLSKLTQSKWTNEIQQYFGNQIIQDIDIVKYNFSN